MFDLELLQSLQSEGWLRAQHHPDIELTIWNYTQRCQAQKHWTPETLACRGLILDEDGDVVARPFGKFFNLGEPGAPGLPVGEPFDVTEKIDGSLMIYYQIDGVGRVASRGSFTSAQAARGTELLREHALTVEPGTTPVFELIAPWNRIVVDYGDREDLVLLDGIDNYTGLSAGPLEWSGRVVSKVHVGDLRDLQGLAKPNAEGFVVSWRRGEWRVKVKFEEYVRLHRVVSGLNEHRIWEALRAGDDLRQLEGLPDETFRFIEETSRRIRGHKFLLRSTADMVVREAPAGIPRKDLAAYFFQSPANPNLCFALYDGKDIEGQLWKIVEPPRTTLGVSGD